MTLHRFALISLVLLILVGIAFAVVIHDTVRYDRPLRAIRGKVTSSGYVVPDAEVEVFDNAEVALDESLPPVEKRKRQNSVAFAQVNDKGEFNVTHLKKGFYEAEIRNHGYAGYGVVSVLVDVDPHGTKDRLCVNLRSEAGGENSVASCN